MSNPLNITKAAFGGLREVTTAPLWQYDYGQILQITGLDLPQAFEVHFSNSRKSGETVTQIGADNQVVIPDMYLTSGADIYCFIFLHDGLTDGETEYVIKVPVRERPEPSDIEPTPEQQDAITEAIAALNTAVTQTGQDVVSADASAQAAAQSATNAQTAAQSAQASATSASGSATTASNAAATATQKASEAAQSASDAESAKSSARNYAASASDSAGDADAAKTAAQSAANTATNKASEASTSATNAAGSASAASASASQASESATSAANSATAASGSATAAAGSATTAATKANEASASATAAQTAQTAAETAQGKAEDAQAAAETAAATFETDTTLTVSGKAADAKATGKYISYLSKETRNIWSLGDINDFVKNSDYVFLPTALEQGKTYTFSADVESNDTYSNDCRVYLCNKVTGQTTSTYFLIGRGIRKSASFTVPVDATRVYSGFLFYASRTASQSAGDTASFKNIQLELGSEATEYIPHITAVDSEIRQDRLKIINKTKWLAVGDSITFGVYSTVENGNVVEKIGNGWIQQLASALNYDLKVMASKGMGYTAAITGQDPDDANSRINLDTLLTRIEALDDDFNLITLAFGTNDYGTPSLSTSASIENGLSDAIERLVAKWKNARIIIITPFNRCSTNSGTKNSKWDCNTTRSQNNLSLHDIGVIISNVCDTYGVECINVTDNSCLNVINISKDLADDVRLLPDKVHPSLNAHTLIAKYMVHYILT